MSPLQLGKTQRLGSSYDRPSLMTAAAKNGPAPASSMIQQHLQQAIDSLYDRYQSAYGQRSGEQA